MPRTELVARLIRDLCLVWVGVLGFVTTPPSLADVGVYGVLSNIWAAMMLGGALAALYGVLRRRVSVEIYGCSFVGVAFVLWAYAAVSQPDASAVSWMVAGVLIAGTAGQAFRVGVLTGRS